MIVGQNSVAFRSVPFRCTSICEAFSANRIIWTDSDNTFSIHYPNSTNTVQATTTSLTTCNCYRNCKRSWYFYESCHTFLWRDSMFFDSKSPTPQTCHIVRFYIHDTQYQQNKINALIVKTDFMTYEQQQYSSKDL